MTEENNGFLFCLVLVSVSFEDRLKAYPSEEKVLGPNVVPRRQLHLYLSTSSVAQEFQASRTVLFTTDSTESSVGVYTIAGTCLVVSLHVMSCARVTSMSLRVAHLPLPTEPFRMARARTHQPLYADSDSEPDENSENEATPKDKRVKPKKRISDVFDPNAANAPHRAPFKSVNMNDDEAEKRKRRKSVKLSQPLAQMVVEDPAATTGQDATNSNGDTPKAARHLKHKQQLMALTEAPIINVPLDVMSSNFEEWMKMATDNVRDICSLSMHLAD